MLPPPENWQGGNSADEIWQEGYNRLGFPDQAIINTLAEEKYDGEKIKAMQERFKGNIQLALIGRLFPIGSSILRKKGKNYKKQLMIQHFENLSIIYSQV